jgi:hypothetical protein
MIYSRWRPDVGGYDYFDDGVPHNINDDLPTPELAGATEIGAPSVESGRPIPPNAVYLASGEWAIGVVAPIEAARIQRRTRSLAGGNGTMAMAEFAEVNPWVGLLGGAALAYVAYRLLRGTG